MVGHPEVVEVVAGAEAEGVVAVEEATSQDLLARRKRNRQGRTKRRTRDLGQITTAAMLELRRWREGASQDSLNYQFSASSTFPTPCPQRNWMFAFEFEWGL